MFCPQCRTEYLEGVDRCTECGSALVGRLESEPGAEGVEVEMVTVFETTDTGLIPVVKALLEAEQIPCVTEREPGAPPFPGVGAHSGRGAVRVPSEFAEAARALVADRTSELAEDVEPSDPTT